MDGNSVAAADRAARGSGGHSLSVQEFRSLVSLAGGHTLILAEILTMHDSKPFNGGRCVLVAMAWS